MPGAIEAMARDAITFIDALGLNTINVVAHSMGGLVAQEVTLARPELVRRLVLVGTGPRGGEGLGALPAWVAELFTRKYEQQQDMWLPILFAPTETSQAAGRAHVERIVARADRDALVSDQSITAQRAALAAYGAAPGPPLHPPQGPGPSRPGRKWHSRHHHPDDQLLHPAAVPPQRRAHLVPRRRPRRAFPISRTVRPPRAHLPRRLTRPRMARTNPAKQQGGSPIAPAARRTGPGQASVYAADAAERSRPGPARPCVIQPLLHHDDGPYAMVLT